MQTWAPSRSSAGSAWRWAPARGAREVGSDPSEDPAGPSGSIVRDVASDRHRALRQARGPAWGLHRARTRPLVQVDRKPRSTERRRVLRNAVLSRSMEPLKSGELHEQDDHLNNSDLHGRASRPSLWCVASPSVCRVSRPWGCGRPSSPPSMGASPEQSMMAPGDGHRDERCRTSLHADEREPHQRSADGTITEAERGYTGERT